MNWLPFECGTILYSVPLPVLEFPVQRGQVGNPVVFDELI